MTDGRGMSKRFHNVSIRFAPVVRRFSAAFAAAKPPLKPLRSTTSAALAIFITTLYAGLKSVCENSVWVCTVEQIAQNLAPQGRNNISLGSKPWVKWGKILSPFRDGTVLTHPLKAPTTCTGGCSNLGTAFETRHAT